MGFKILKIHQLRRIILSFLHDIGMAALSFIISLYLRLGAELFLWPKMDIFIGMIIFTSVATVVFISLRLDKIIWRYVSLGDLGKILRCVALTIIIFIVCQFVYNRLDAFPRSFLVIEFFILTAMITSPRFLYRFLKDGEFGALLEKANYQRTPVLLVGAGNDSDLFIREMKRGKEAPYRIVGIIDETDKRVGRSIRGVPVLGNLAAMPNICRQLERDGIAPQRVVITDPIIDGQTVRDIVEISDKLGLPLSRMPQVANLGNMKPKPSSFEIRPINVEDVLGRPQMVLDPLPVKNLIFGCTVLITGAGGTIGSELAQQVAGFQPAKIIILDNSEFHLYKINLQLEEKHPKVERHAILGDVQRLSDIENAIRLHTPDVVIHSAALKHVPVAEENIIAAVRTNVLGTRNVASTVIKKNVKAMVLISTDKAVNPTNVMGATKKLSELICNNFQQGSDSCKFVSVRFGNVLGSTGSVIPLFERQIAAGGPITVTHPDMMRFFMTVKEATSLVLQAAAIPPDTVKSQNGNIFVLEMGEPVKILDLAMQLVRLSGLRPNKDIAIKYTGIRSGEKLYEELFDQNETLLETTISDIKLVSSGIKQTAEFDEKLNQLEKAVDRRDERATLNYLCELVPTFTSKA